MLLVASSAQAACKLSVSKQKFEGAERTIVTMENDRILVDIVPELEGRIARYRDKTRPGSAFEALDDCPYHYGGRWEGKPFTHRIDAKGPDRAAVTVQGGGKIAVALLQGLLGVDLASPLDLPVERTMSIDASSTPAASGREDHEHGRGHCPGVPLHGPRGVRAGAADARPAGPSGSCRRPRASSSSTETRRAARWARRGRRGAAGPSVQPLHTGPQGRQAPLRGGRLGAALTSAGPVFMFYDPKQFDFMQYWFGGDAEWHLTFEPHTKPVDLKPGESVSCSFTLAYDSQDVPFNTDDDRLRAAGRAGRGHARRHAEDPGQGDHGPEQGRAGQRGLRGQGPQGPDRSSATHGRRRRAAVRLHRTECGGEAARGRRQGRCTRGR